MHCARNTLALHSTPVGPSPGPSPVGRGVICEVTPIGLPIRGVGRFIFHAWEVYLSCLGGFFSYAWEVFSLTEHTEFTEVFGTHFEPTERLRHTEFTERYC